MMRLPLLAACAAVAAAGTTMTPETCKLDTDCGEGLFCRTAVAASGGVCDPSLPKTCVKLSGRGETCGGDGEAYECFRNRCKEPLACRKTSLEAKALGTCVKQCTVELEGGKTMTVYEGWRGPALKQWCHKRYCDGSGDKEGGELKEVLSDEVCPQSLKEGLRCCVGESEDGKNQECCGANGQWVTPVEGKVTCAGVEATVGGDLAAPFSRTCTGVCKREGGAAAVDDGWKGRSTEEGEWCNTCVCARGALECTERKCSALKCCSTGDREKSVVQACCGVTGEWVTKDAKDNVVCGGVTLPYSDTLTTAPFHASCTEPRTCALFSNVAVTVPHGETVADPRRGRGCNECTCTDGKLTCATAVCEGLKCCKHAAKPTGEQLCCGLTGEWVALAGGKCGAYATQGEEKPVPATATGYPFFKACAQQCAANTDAGGPDETLPVGWTGSKGTSMVGGMMVKPLWCDTCTCAFAEGAAVDAPPVLTCTSHAACPAANCCRGKAPADSGYACCGVSRQWVKVVEGKVACGGVMASAAKATAPLSEECATCTLPGGVVLSEGLSGSDAGAHWCKRCRCENGVASCTKDAGATCEKKCCSAEVPKTLASAAYRCCGASGAWVALDAKTKTYQCGGAVVADGAVQLFADPAGTGTDEEKGMCARAVEKTCTLHNEAATVVKQGWGGSGLGDKWCHRCKCRAEDVGKPVSCPAGDCPKKEALKCCGADKAKDDEVCCGLTGEWVAKDAVCGAVDLGLAGAVKAPVTAACPKCTLESGAEVSPGWFDFAPGADWCNKCVCGADGTLRCTKRKCRKPTCCAGDKGADTDVCCGATGKWVPVGTGADAGKYACGGLKTDKADLLPFFEKCTTGCVLDDMTPVAVGWAGKKGDGCNYCYCQEDKLLKCSARVCPTPPPTPAPTPPPGPATMCGDYDCGVHQHDGTNTDCGGPCDKAACCFLNCVHYFVKNGCVAGRSNADPCSLAQPCNDAKCCNPVRPR